MSSILMKETHPMYAVLCKHIEDGVEKEHGFSALFAGHSNSRVFGMHNKTSDFDFFIVYADKSGNAKMPFVDLNRELILMDIELIHQGRKQIYKNRKYPTYHNRSDEEREIESKLEPKQRPDEFVTELIFCQHVWDGKGYLREHWSEIRENHLNTLRTVNMYYSYGRGNYDNRLGNSEILARKYLNTVHRALSIRYMLETNELPPINLEELLKTCKDEPARKETLNMLLWYREQYMRKTILKVSRNDAIHAFLENEYPKLREAITELSVTCPERLLDVEI